MESFESVATFLSDEKNEIVIAFVFQLFEQNEDLDDKLQQTEKHQKQNEKGEKQYIFLPHTVVDIITMVIEIHHASLTYITMFDSLTLFRLFNLHNIQRKLFNY